MVIKKSAIFTILLIGIGLRLISANQSFWLDEAVQVWASRHFTFKSLIQDYMPGDFNPPLYHILTFAWMKLFNSSELLIRLLPIGLGTASLAIFWKIAKQIGDSRLAFLAGLFLATSPLHIYYSQENRMYVLAGLGVLLTVWRLLVLNQKPTWFNSFWLTISLLIMGFSHFLTLFLVPVLILPSIIKKENRLMYLFPFLILFLAYCLYWPLLALQLKTGLDWKTAFPVWGATVGNLSPKAAALLPIKFIIGRIGLENKFFYALLVGILLPLFWGPVLYQVKNKQFRPFLYLLLVPPVLSLLSSFWVPTFSYFRFLFVLPFFYLLLAQTIKNQKPIVWGIFLGLNLVFSGIYLLNPKFHREGWREMTNYLYQQNQQQSSVFVLSQISKPFEYYDRGRSTILNIETVFVNPQAIGSEMFLVSYGLPIFDPEDTIRGQLKTEGYRLADNKDFRSVGIERWVKQAFQDQE